MGVNAPTPAGRNSRRMVVLGVWLLTLALCATVIARTRFTADLSAFLPQAPSAAQQVLVEQLKDGVVSRLLLVGLRDADAGTLAALNKAMAARLRQDARFADISNGEPQALEADREFVYRNRYVLSERVSAAHFEPAALRAHLEEALSLLSSEAGMMVKPLIGSDPTGETLHLAQALAAGGAPATHDGIWASRDGVYSLMLVQTRAPGFDMDAQAQALSAVRAAFEAARTALGSAQAHTESARTQSSTAQPHMDLVGPAVFSVQTRDAIKGDAEKFALAAGLIVAGMLWVVFRSLRLLALGLVPVATGVAAGVTAVSLVHGEVHGITLGFGATLIGEAVDYAIYLFLQSEGRREQGGVSLRRLWPTLRLGVLTSVVGFSALFLSHFPGLAQLGLFSIAGLVAAVTVTRFVLPVLLPADFRVEGIDGAGHCIHRALAALRRLRPFLALATGVCVALVLARGPALWHDELSSLSPVPHDAQMLDGRLRAELGAPDVRHMLVISAIDQESGLRLAEAVGARLEAARAQGLLAGFDTPARYLPSQQAQQARRDALPARGVLSASLNDALIDLPFEAGAFAAFIDEVERARDAPSLDRDALDATRLALRFDSLVVRRTDRWFAMLPLMQVSDAGALKAALAPVMGGQVALLDLKAETDGLYRAYRQEAVWLSALGALAIVALLAVSLRSVRRAVVVCGPLAMAVVLTVALLLWRHEALTLFHLVGILLVVAVGSNYALFFERGLDRDGQAPRTAVSLLTANLSTMVGFGLLGFSQVPVLAAIGSVVGIGALLSLVCAAALSDEIARPHA